MPQKKKERKTNVDKDFLKGEQLVFYSNDEIAAIQTLIAILIKENRKSKPDELSSLKGGSFIGGCGNVRAYACECNPV